MKMEKNQAAEESAELHAESEESREEYAGEGDEVDSCTDLDELGQGEAEDGNADEGEPERELAEEEALDELVCTQRKKLTNQFNFSERGAMTYRPVYRVSTWPLLSSK